MESTSILNSFNLVDLVVGIYLLYGIIRGYRRGLSGELARVISVVVVLFAGWQFYEPMGEKLEEITRLSTEGSQVTGFLLTLIAAGLFMVLLRWVLKNLMEFTFKGGIERVGGMIAGFLRCLAYVSAIVIAASLSPIDYLAQKLGEESRIGSVITHQLVPAYQSLAENNPDLGLPTLPGDPAPEPEAPEEPPDDGRPGPQTDD